MPLARFGPLFPGRGALAASLSGPRLWSLELKAWSLQRGKRMEQLAPILGVYLPELPLYLAWLAGIVVTLVRWRQ
jgi:hypothetical protein